MRAAAAIAIAISSACAHSVEPPAGTSAPIVSAWRRLNEARRLGGVPPVAFARGLSRGAALHARYLVLNRVAPFVSSHSPELQFYRSGAHTERPGDRGYSAEGERAARESVIAYDTDLADAVEELLATCGHRMAMLSAEVTAIGIASEASGTTFVHVIRLRRDGKRAARPSVYPAPDQRDVPLTFLGENPDPRPPEWFANRPDRLPNGAISTGTPITIDFGRARVGGVRGAIRDELGASLDAYLDASEWAFHTTACLMPARPLLPSKRYSVAIDATVDGAPWRMTWSFTTTSRAR